MKRIIPFLLLAFVAVACERDGPTVPVDGPQFAKPNCPGPHPSCKDGDGDGAGAYTAIDLDPGERRLASNARDLNEPQPGDPLLVVGSSETASGHKVATLWTVFGTEPGTKKQLGTGPSNAHGINDAGTIIVGFTGTSWVDNRPGYWSNGDGVWIGQALDPLLGYNYGSASSINGDGYIVGTSRQPDSPDLGGYTAGTVWPPGSTTPVAQLPSPLDDYGEYTGYGTSAAADISDAGYVVGWSRPPNPDASPWHAVFWRPTADPQVYEFCDLHMSMGGGPGGRSAAYGVTDLDSGNVLVVGWYGSNVEGIAVVWEVDPGWATTGEHDTEGTCVVEAKTLTTAGEAYDVAIVGDQVEAVGLDASSSSGQPVRWLVATGAATLLHDGQGEAYEINRTGLIVGQAKVKRTNHATLWIPNL